MLIARLTIPLVLAFSVASCAPVKQKQPPRIPDDTGSDGLGDDSGSDMAPEKPDTIEVANDDGPKETEEQKRVKCCQQCVDGIADDKSGDPPGAIPCTKLTSKMEAGCVVWHDKNPMTGKEAQQCVDDAAKPEEDPDGLD